MAQPRRSSPTRLDPRRPLVFDVRPLGRSAGSARSERRAAPAPAGLANGMAWVPEGATVDLDVLLEAVTEGVLVTATATAPVEGECARCLDPVAQTAEVRCQELFRHGAGRLGRDDEQDAGVGDDDGYSLDGDLLDFESALRDALVLALPLAPLCREDCPGLCAECGAHLAQAGPEHVHDPAIDPRWAALRRPTEEGPDGTPVPGPSEES